MTPQQKAAWAIFDYVKCSVECDFCRDKISSYSEDSFDLAKIAHEEGWRVRKDQLRCPDCINKKKVS